MADAVMRASTEMSAIVPEVWSARFYDVLLAQLPFASLIDNSYEGEIKDLGDTVNISSFPEFDSGVELAEDARNDAESITVSGQQLVINKRVAKDFIITRLATLQSLAHMDKLRELAVYSLMKKMQSIIVAAIVPSPSAPDHTIAYDSSSTLALADLLEIKELLDAQDVPAGDRSAVLGAAQMNDLFNITGFTSSDFLLAQSGAPLATGLVPPLVGFNVSMTTEVGNTSYYFHKSFMTIAVQDPVRVMEYDLGVDGIRGTRVNCDVLFGIKQLDNLRVATLG
jgi:hypothetical protein